MKINTICHLKKNRWSRGFRFY